VLTIKLQEHLLHTLAINIFVIIIIISYKYITYKLLYHIVFVKNFGHLNKDAIIGSYKKNRVLRSLIYLFLQ